MVLGQGCPLSPLLFALCIEPLASLVRLHSDIPGVLVCNREFLISLYADDILPTLTYPLISLPNLHRKFLGIWRALGLQNEHY